MKTHVNIDIIRTVFSGSGQKPIVALSDRDYNGPNSDIETIRERYDNNLTETGWRQLRQKHRDEGDKIRINIYCHGLHPFVGHLEVSLSCNKNLKRTISLPLEIREANPQQVYNPRLIKPM